MSNIFFTADTHFFHDAIRRYSGRPFSSIEEMDEALIDNWNSVVTDRDIIYHLGDFGFCHINKAKEIYGRLKGREKHLILGNHDKDRKIHDLFTSSAIYREIKLDGQAIILMHYAMRVWNKSHHGSISLHGHSHHSLPGNNQSLDVGVDGWDYYPVTFDQIKERLKTLPPYISGDHHTPNSDT